MNKRRAWAAVATLVAGLVGAVVTPTPARAASILCSGLTPCTTAPYTDHGWQAAMSTSHWGQYAGDNCTNYVAYYEETVNGMPASRPSWLLVGHNADDWASEATAAGITVSGTPVIGAVAQWGDFGWNGNAGHVGIIEEVSNNGTTIKVSWANSYQWVTLSTADANTSTSVGWPQHFIYLGGVPVSGSGTPRVITLDAAGGLAVKEGALGATWTPVLSGVADYRASSNRIAALDTTGALWVKEGAINTVWQSVATGVSPGNFAVTNDMVAVLWGTDLYTKTGSLGASWVLTINPVQSFRVSAGDHIAAMLTNGYLYVQWGAVGSGWTAVANAISEYDLTDSLVAVRWGTDLCVKQGSVGAPWTLIVNPVNGFALSASNHVAAGLTNSDLVVQWGPVGTGWVTVTTGYTSFAVTDNRVGVLQSGSLSIKEGSVAATWTTIATGVVSFALT